VRGKLRVSSTRKFPAGRPALRETAGILRKKSGVGEGVSTGGGGGICGGNRGVKGIGTRSGGYFLIDKKRPGVPIEWKKTMSWEEKKGSGTWQGPLSRRARAKKKKTPLRKK